MPSHILPGTAFFHRLADAADEVTLFHYRTSLTVEEKLKPGYSFDPVTEADRETEKALRALIANTFPDHGILGEEFGATGDSTVEWVIDPIDGTRPYLCGIPVWGTLIGLMIDRRTRMGLMSQAVTGERFWSLGQESWMSCRGRITTLATRDNRDLASAILHTNSPDRYDEFPEFVFSTLRDQVKMTRYGAECYAFAMLAAGLIDICIDPDLQIYDIAALIPIVEGAGGLVTNLRGERADQGGHIVAASNAWLHERVLNALNAG